MTGSINLLPWREERRGRRQRTLIVALLLAGLVAGLVCWGWEQVAADRLAAQALRNRQIRQELARLDDQAGEIDELRRRRQQLEVHLKVIEALRGSRPVTVHLFDQLVRTLPDGLYYTRVECRDGGCTINGVAESNARISSLMKNLALSPWFQRPRLLSVTATAGSMPRSASASGFVLTTQQDFPSPAGKEGKP